MSQNRNPVVSSQSRSDSLSYPGETRMKLNKREKCDFSRKKRTIRFVWKNISAKMHEYVPPVLEAVFEAE